VIDVEATLRAVLVKRMPAGTNIFAAANLPAGYTPTATGPAVLFQQRGGTQPYHSRTLKSSVQFRCYGPNEAEARKLDRTLFDALNDVQAFEGLQNARCAVVGQLLVEPQTEWRFVLSFWDVFLKNSYRETSVLLVLAN